MAGVKVILQQDVPNLGTAGEIKQVAPGYFRNYLLPRGLAIEASPSNLHARERSASSATTRATRQKERTDTLARQIQDTTVTIPVRLGGQGRIYGSVTNKDIAEALASQAAITVDRHKIELHEPLKSLGIHSVPIKLEHGFEPQLRVELVPEAETVQS